MVSRRETPARDPQWVLAAAGAIALHTICRVREQALRAQDTQRRPQPLTMQRMREDDEAAPVVDGHRDQTLALEVVEHVEPAELTRVVEPDPLTARQRLQDAHAVIADASEATREQLGQPARR